MKKTLIALAAVAAASTSFAQVSITGGVDFTFGKTTTSTAASTAWALNPLTGVPTAAVTPAGSLSKGLAATDAYIDVNVAEDLGGGLKAVVNMEFNADGSWGAGAYSGDKNITLASGSGSITLANARSGSILNNIMLAPIVSSTDHWSGANAGVMARGNVDAMVLMLPAMSGITVGYKYVEGGDSYLSPTSVTHVLYGKYASGPLTIVGEYNIRASEYLVGDVRGQRTDLTATYDAGVAKFAVGYESANLGTNNNTSVGPAAAATLVSVNAPVGNHAVGMNWGKRDAASFTEFGGQYNFSKTTYVAASIGTIVDQANNSSDTFGVRLGKNF
jgi:predicted porin